MIILPYREYDKQADASQVARPVVVLNISPHIDARLRREDSNTARLFSILRVNTLKSRHLLPCIVRPLLVCPGMFSHESEGCFNDRSRLRRIVDPIEAMISLRIIHNRELRIQPQRRGCESIYPGVE